MVKGPKVGGVAAWVPAAVAGEIGNDLRSSIVGSGFNSNKSTLAGGWAPTSVPIIHTRKDLTMLTLIMYVVLAVLSYAMLVMLR